MKAISLWQPWGSLWLSPRKLHETRHWATSHRGWIAVHAAKRFEKDLPSSLASILRAEFGAQWFRSLPTGAVIGAVRITDCVPTEAVFPEDAPQADDWQCGNFEPGRFAWKRDEIRVLSEPIPYRGAQGIFFVTGDAAKALRDITEAHMIDAAPSVQD